ncbi:MAG: hypothetical protein NC489_16620 [Ruminococcus flavefaciens]|nr:hypothetical protein [Ruminococcus flavefaciens]
MSYLDVGKEYEDRLIAGIKADPEEGCIFPCFAESCTDEILQARVNKRIEEAYANKDINPHMLISIFAQYLYDQYHVLPEDLEFICQGMFTGIVALIENSAAQAAEYLSSGACFIDSNVKQRGDDKPTVIPVDFGSHNSD